MSSVRGLFAGIFIDISDCAFSVYGYYKLFPVLADCDWVQGKVNYTIKDIDQQWITKNRRLDIRFNTNRLELGISFGANYWMALSGEPYDIILSSIKNDVEERKYNNSSVLYSYFHEDSELPAMPAIPELLIDGKTLYFRKSGYN